MKIKKLTILFLALAVILAVALAYVALSLSKGDTSQNTAITPNSSSVTPSIVEGSSDIDTSDWKTYRNEELGISFEYDAFDQYSGKPHLIKQLDNKVTLHVADNDFGHTITVFYINDLTPQEYLKKNLMNNIDDRCRVEVKKGSDNKNFKYNDNYSFLSITSYNQNDPVESVYTINCGQYGNINSIAYFLYNNEIRDKLLWVSLGQDTSLKHYQDYLSSITIFN